MLVSGLQPTVSSSYREFASVEMIPVSWWMDGWKEGRSRSGEKQNWWLSARSRSVGVRRTLFGFVMGLVQTPGSVPAVVVCGGANLYCNRTGCSHSLFCWMDLIRLQLDYVTVIGYIVTLGLDTYTFYWKVLTLLLLCLVFWKGIFCLLSQGRTEIRFLQLFPRVVGFGRIFKWISPRINMRMFV